MAVFNLVLLICALRTNIIFVMTFVCLECAFAFVAASNFYGAQGDIGPATAPGSGGNYHYYRVVSETLSMYCISE
jgi:succinate-acetate transporter protein